VSECVRVGTKIAIVEVNNYFSHEETALRQIGAKPTQNLAKPKPRNVQNVALL
jgi:hypothetical protein